jgi:site-specific recombinase XerD
MDKKGFITYLEGKDFAIKTINNYVKYAEEFLKTTKKEDLQITKPDILKFLEYLKNTRKIQNAYRSYYLVALNHYFTFLYNDGKIAINPCLFLKIRGIKRKTLYKIYSPEELEELFDTYYQLFVRSYDDSHLPKNRQNISALSKERNALILSILINQGIATGEIDRIEINDIDLKKATIKIRGGKHGNERVLPLKATQIGLFINYLQNIRHQFLEYQKDDTNKLFLPLPNGNQKKTDTTKSQYAFYMLTNAIKTIDKQFINVLQIRASVITFWIKTQGLRKAQYLAGHRYICTTEKYLPNNLDNLIDDINKLHPFL